MSPVRTWTGAHLQGLECILSSRSGAFCSRHGSSLSLSCLGCQPDHGTGTRAARVFRGSQVLGGRLLPGRGGATPPAVPQVSQPAVHRRSTHLVGGPRPGLSCDSFSSACGRAELA